MQYRYNWEIRANWENNVIHHLSGLVNTLALFQLSFVQFRPYATSFLGLLLSVTLMPKSKKTLETSLDLILLFKTSFDVRVDRLVSNVDYLENQHCNFIQKKYGRNRRLPHTRCFFFFVQTFYTVMTPKGTKINKVLSKTSKHITFVFFGLEFQNSI